ncbi:histidinol-phosphate transaminase [Thiomicrorhabdus sp. 6S3-12]|uniref:histidinol-phosphate transaminase n=1 Tax=Thiomicrorhabdus sp. 6S3-12 TaxID=2819681 RepID=UPI001AAD1788|nr:histidinol-phosphate transaminase [Thiomicrorhabdus sp. 6S3-12]MBO1925120.1 histidinol-phosphate transaminase [Thiomicrorhabdus sp. 6S3-12]
MSETSEKFIDLVQPAVTNVSPYQPGKPIDQLKREYKVSYVSKMASNENPLGSSLKVATALVNFANQMSRYPDADGHNLRAKLAEFLKIDMSEVTLGNGSNELLELVARVFAGPGDEIIYSQYGFAVYPISAQIVGATAVEVPAVNYGHDLQAMLAAITPKTKIIYVANPNNPTGTLFRRDEWEAFISQVPENVIVVLDEAYLEYAENACRDGSYPNGAEYFHDYPNLLVSRTFSKAYGLASLRIGYMLGCEEILQYISRLRQPFSVNAYAQVAAMTALTDPQFVSKSLRINDQGMMQIRAAVEAKGLKVIPSYANFLTIEFGENALEIYDKLLHEGVIVRPLANYGMADFLRVSIGNNHENSHFMGALNKVL